MIFLYKNIGNINLRASFQKADKDQMGKVGIFQFLKILEEHKMKLNVEERKWMTEKYDPLSENNINYTHFCDDIEPVLPQSKIIKEKPKSNKNIYI